MRRRPGWAPEPCNRLCAIGRPGVVMHISGTDGERSLHTVAESTEGAGFRPALSFDRRTASATQ